MIKYTQQTQTITKPNDQMEVFIMGRKLTSIKGYTKSNGTKVKSHRRRTAR